MAGIGHRGFMGRKKGVIPVPQAGVCTPYPIPIPVQTDLIHYSSCFNCCDLKQYNDGTTDITTSPSPNSFYTDLSGEGNDCIGVTTPQPSDARGSIYNDLGTGNVYWSNKVSPQTQMSPNKNWRLNTDVKTVLILCRTPDITNGTTTRIGFHYNNGFVQFSSSKLRLSPAPSMTNILAANNTWMVISVRCDDNVVLGIDKSYEEVLASAPSISNTDFFIWTANGVNGNWAGDIREIAIYSESLSDTDTDTMVDYMKTKWNLI